MPLRADCTGLGLWRLYITDRGILAIDIGSSSVRTRIYGESLEPIPGPFTGARAPYRWRTSNGGMECDADELFHRAVRVVDAAVAAAREQDIEIAAVAVTTFWHGLLGVDLQGEPITPLYGWGDVRAAEVLPWLRHELGEPEYHRRTGCFLQPTYPAVKLAWLRRADPGAFGAAAAWLSIGEYFEQRLFASNRSSFSLASGTGLLDVRNLEWDEPMLNALGIGPHLLPQLTNFDPASGLRPRWGERWPELAGVPFLPAAGDGACANVGCGAIGEERPGLTVGTSAAVRVIRRTSADDPPDDLWEYRLDRHHRVTGAALSNGGVAVELLLRTFPSLDIEAVDLELLRREPDSHGLTVLATPVPERRGERSSASGAAVIGVRLDTEPSEIGRAWLESITHHIAAELRRLEQHLGNVAEVRATGGALQSMPGWVQSFADAFDRPMRMAADPEATSRGAAVLAAREIGWIESLEAAPALVQHRVAPDPERHRQHLRAAAREQRVARALASGLGGPSRPEAD